MHVTEYYGITDDPSLPFVDVNVQRDSALFVDPRAIRLDRSNRPYAHLAQADMTSFFNTVSNHVLFGDQQSQAEGLRLLQAFREPRETRLGLARAGFNGHGGSDEVGHWIWQALVDNSDAFRRIAICTQLEDIPLFVSGVGNDITSDLTTRIVYEALALFTGEMLKQFPEFSAGNQQVERVTVQVWDNQGRAWVERGIDLPVAFGAPLLLVPRNWARPTILMNAQRYFDVTILGYLQERETTIALGTDKILRPTKDTLRRRPTVNCSRAFITRTAVHAGDDGVNLTRRFKSFVDAKFTPISTEVLKSKTE